MFKKLVCIFISLLFFNSCAVKPKSFATSDWYAYTKTSTERVEATKIYDFSDGMIRMYGENIGYLMTYKSYSNFELSMDFKWNIDEKYKQGNGAKNSGVMYNIPTNSADHIWPKGIQFQIKEEVTGDFIFIDNITAKVNGKLVEAGASVSSPKFLSNEKPHGEWNSIIIKSFNGKLTQYLNGKLVNECTEVASQEGRISLNYEGHPIDFRNIQIKNLSVKE